MKEERLKELLDRYYKGETSENEENQLKEFFSGENFIDGFDAEKEIFRNYSVSEIIPVPSRGFKDRIFEAVDKSDKNQKDKTFRKRFIMISGAAAAILLLVGSYFIFFSQAEHEDTFSDPQLAYAETIKILNEVSVKLNKATEALKPLSSINDLTTGISSMDRSADIISKNLQRIKILEDKNAEEERENVKEK